MSEVKTTIQPIAGFKVAGVAAGIKKKAGALDFALIVSDVPCHAAGVFTTNLVKAAPVLVDQDKLNRSGGIVRAIAINSGCANAATGQQGMDNAYETARYVAEKIGCHEDEVLVMSTGVIGVQLPMEKIKHGVDLAVDNLGADNWELAARAIMTTDTHPKQASIVEDGYSVAGIAKGAGMIAPNMATMLGFMVTDADLSTLEAKASLLQTAGTTFNRIVVDGDMSTNDTVLLLANGVSGAKANSDFTSALQVVSKQLAQAIVRDGEGVTKFVTIKVQGTEDDASARQIANTIATSPLVKTAFYGNDANWGRIIAAAGRANVDFDATQIQLEVVMGAEKPEGDPLMLVFAGTPCDYSEAVATEIVSSSEFIYTLTVGAGNGQATIWTCDLSHKYVSINADYRT